MPFKCHHAKHDQIKKARPQKLVIFDEVPSQFNSQNLCTFQQ